MSIITAVTKKLFLSSIGILALVLAAWMASPGAAAPLAQPTPFPTPTPGPDGRIIYIVQPDDTLWRISAVSGVSIDELRTLNNLGVDDVLVQGQPILLGLAGPAIVSPTVGPTSTPQDATPTVTPSMGSGILCILLYEDLNGDSLRQESEVSIPGGAVSIIDRSGQTSITGETQSGTEPDCFPDIPEGDYNISVAAPEGFNPTTVMSYALRITQGDETYLDFGAQQSSAVATVPSTGDLPAATGGESPSLWLGIIGGILILGGIGLAVYAFRMRG